MLLISDRGTYSVEHLARWHRGGYQVLCPRQWPDYHTLYEAQAESLTWQQASFLSLEQQRRQGSTLPQEHDELAVLPHDLIDPTNQQAIPARLIFVDSTADEQACRQRRHPGWSGNLASQAVAGSSAMHSVGLAVLLTTAALAQSADLLFGFYQQQNDVELLHHAWKTPLAVRPGLIKNPRRVEALVCLLQVALQAYIGCVLIPGRRAWPSRSLPATLAKSASHRKNVYRSGTRIKVRHPGPSDNREATHGPGRAFPEEASMRRAVLCLLLLPPLLWLSQVRGEPGTPELVLHVDASKVLNQITPLMYGACIEDVNHEIYGGLYAQMIFGESFEEPPRPKPATLPPGISGMWDAVQTGTVQPRWTWDADHPFHAARSQKIELRGGQGTVGIANRGLNHWGLTVRQGHTYAGRLYLRGAGHTGKVTVALQSRDGHKTYARQALGGIGRDWARHDFSLYASGTDTNARFAVWLDQPGAVWIDQVYLSGTGPDLFHGLPFRADIGQKLVDEGLTVLRYGGSMVNAPDYRWKKMIGDRDRRPEYTGTWYPHSTNGFGIEDFVQFCDAAGFEKVFAINIEETPQDAADLVDYLNGAVDTRWGRQRAANGHPRPYGVKYIEIGNEEKTDAHYLERFKLLEAAMHARDPKLQLIIAAWWEPDNPVSRRLVRELDGKAAVWDVHVGGDNLREGRNVDRLFTRMEKLVQTWAPGTRLRACVLEENGGRHDLQRALGHAGILGATQRHGNFVRLDCPANCLQPWRQNDNGWDQGQVFFTSSQVWGMPPFYAQQMASANHLPCRVAADVHDRRDLLDLTATRSKDGKTLVLSIVNIGNQPVSSRIELAGFGPVQPRAEVWTLTGQLTERNSPQQPQRVQTQRSTLSGAAERFTYSFLPRSYTILRLQRR